MTHLLNNTLLELDEGGLTDDLVKRMDNSALHITTEKILSSRYGLEREVRSNEYRIDQNESQTCHTARLIRLMCDIEIIESSDNKKISVIFPDNMNCNDQLFLENRLNGMVEILKAHRDVNMDIDIIGKYILALEHSGLNFLNRRSYV